MMSVQLAGGVAHVVPGRLELCELNLGIQGSFPQPRRAIKRPPSFLRQASDSSEAPTPSPRPHLRPEVEGFHIWDARGS